MRTDVARWQFAFVTVDHFFVPVTIGLAVLTALPRGWRRPRGQRR